MREPLKEKTELLLSGSGGKKRFTLTGVLGVGSNCISYSAVSEAGIPCVIKECCPWSTSRGSGGEVLWKRDAQQAKERFERAYRAQLEIMRKPDLINKGAFVTDSLHEANSTLYSVIEAKNCVSYDSCENESLKNILLTARSIAAAVEVYHKYGWLLLDLKPDNVMIYPETRELALIVDFDGIVKAAEVKDSSVEITYSYDYAAPEVRQNLRKEIGFAADIYSVGAIMFSKLFGRCPESLDSVFECQWSTADTVLEGIVDPGLTKRIFELLHRTLSANPDSRYSNASELVAELDKLILMLNRGAPYVVSNNRGLSAEFFGRGAELKYIHSALEKNSRVFIHGFRGMGKSALAKKYIEEYGGDYDAVLFLRYDESLKATLDKVTVFNASPETEHFDALRAALARQKVLVVVDNFDVPPDGDKELSACLNLGADMIFTTRTDFSDTGLKAAFLKIRPLEKPVLHEMFEYLSETDIQNEAAFDGIVALTDGHTYFMSLLANYVRASGKSLNAVLDRLAAGIGGFENSEKVTAEKDGSIRSTTVYAAIKEMFDMSGITSAKKRVLCDLWLLRTFLLTKDDIRALFALIRNTPVAESTDAFNELLDLGWICRDESENGAVFYLHPIVQELVEKNFAPCIRRFKEVRRFMRVYIIGKADFMYALEKDKEPGREARQAALVYINSVTSFLASLMNDRRNYNYVRTNLGDKKERAKLRELTTKESTREMLDRLPKLYGKLWLGRTPYVLLVFLGFAMLSFVLMLSSTPPGMTAAKYLKILLLPVNRHIIGSVCLTSVVVTALIFLIALLYETQSASRYMVQDWYDWLIRLLKNTKRLVLRLVGKESLEDRNYDTLFDTAYPWELLVRKTAVQPDELLQDLRLMTPKMKNK